MALSNLLLALLWSLSCVNLTEAFLMFNPFPDIRAASDSFDWSSLLPSEKLEYRECYDTLECARLEVPLDWSNLSNPNKVSVAVARLPAIVDVSSDEFGGTIVLNPGGPSGSGIEYLLAAGRILQQKVDGKKHFEILSFDPRGTQFTTPSLACFGDDRARLMYLLWNEAAGPPESSEYAFNTKWAAASGLDKLCGISKSGLFSDGSNILNYMSTALVAQDMIAIIDSVQEHRAYSLFSAGRDGDSQFVLPNQQTEPQKTLLNYWGFSYGTYLGNTFASMYPSRVGRMILDGVVDAQDYAATGWTTNLQDTNQTWATFFRFCFEAGKKCPLTSLGFDSAKNMQVAVENFLEEINENPVPLVAGGQVQLLTFSTLRALIFQALYFPDIFWRDLAIILLTLMKGDSIGYLSKNPLKRLRAIPPITLRLSDTMESQKEQLEGYPASYEVSKAIICGDGDDLSLTTKIDFGEYIDLLRHQSPYFGSLWAGVTVECRRWPKHSRPAERNRFTGPFESNLSTYDPRGSPLLFFSTVADPVTPLRNAYKMAAQHEGAKVLLQNTPGHCTGVYGPSHCTSRVASEFFATGQLPKDGTVCQGDRRPWDEWQGQLYY